MMRTVFDDLGVVGIGVVLLVVAICICRPTMGSKYQPNNQNIQSHLAILHRD
jgi:hypothetical protein